MSIFLPPALVCRAGEVLQRGAELFLLPLPFPSCADKSNIKIFLPNFTFNERNCRRKIAEENCVRLLTQKVTLHHPPHLSSTWVLPLNGPKKPIAPPYILSFVLCMYFSLSKSSWLDGLQEKTGYGKSLLAKESFGSSKSSTHWKVKILGKLGQWRDRIMVTYFILHFGQNWRNAFCSWIMWGKEVELPFFLEVESRTWGNRRVHEHTLSIFPWHPNTSASREFLGLNTVAKNLQIA